MSQLGMIDRANNSPLFAASLVNLTPSAANANNVFGNTTFGVFLNNGVAMKKAFGTFGISTVEAGNTVSGGTKAAHAGWNTRTAFTGYLATLTVATVGKLYTNGDIVTVAPSGGTLVSSNATAVITTNASGNIVSTSITSGGAGFITAAPTAITVANSTGGATTGSNAVFTATAGGRAGRVQLETLVAAGSITGDGDGTLF